MWFPKILEKVEIIKKSISGREVTIHVLIPWSGLRMNRSIIIATNFELKSYIMSHIKGTDSLKWVYKSVKYFR